MARVLVVGSARRSGGGVASVIRLFEQMPVWREYGCYWLETQIQAGTLTKLWYAVRASVKGFFMMPGFDAVHMHTVPDRSMTVQLPIMLWARLWRKKVILHIHCGNQLAMPMCTKDRIAQWCMGQADALILLAESFMPLLDRYWPGAKGKRFVLYNPHVGRGMLEAVEKKKTILFAGIFNNNKAADVLIKAFAKVHRSYPDWRLQLLGNGPEESNLRNLIHECGLDGQVDMPGYLFGADKESYFKTAGIYAMCSHYEGFPMVVLEAWSHATAVVTTPVGGLPDVLVSLEEHQSGLSCNEANAMVFDYDDAEGLSLRLSRLMRDDSLRCNLGENGRRLVMNRFSMDRINEDLRRIYAESLD